METSRRVLVVGYHAAELGVTPGRFVRQARTEAAGHLLTGTDLTVEAIAGRCGLGTAEALRQAFVSAYGVSPSHYRLTQSRSARHDSAPMGRLPSSNPA